MEIQFLLHTELLVKQLSLKVALHVTDRTLVFCILGLELSTMLIFQHAVHWQPADLLHNTSLTMMKVNINATSLNKKEWDKSNKVLFLQHTRGHVCVCVLEEEYYD